MKFTSTYLIATNTNLLQDQPDDIKCVHPIIHETKAEDWYISRRITALFPFFDQRGMLESRKPTRDKRQGKSTRVTVDNELDKKFRSLLGL